MNISGRKSKDPYRFNILIQEKYDLYGREDIVKKIKDQIIKHNIKITLLHVQRRIGKSSLITCLPQYFTDEQNGFKFVTLSFEERKHQTISKILNDFADEIAANIENLPQQVREKADGLENFFELFLPIIIDKYFLGKKLVLILYECDVLNFTSFMPLHFFL